MAEPTSRKNIVNTKASLSVERQCELLEIRRATYYYKPVQPDDEAFELKLRIMGWIDFWHNKMPSLGTRGLRKKLADEGLNAGRKRIKSYMAEMGIYAVYPKPKLSVPNKFNPIYPYLLRNKPVFMPNQVWAIDITYIKMSHGHMYLTAIIDWFSRYIVGWSLSDTLDTAPVLDAVKAAIEAYGIPAIINSDQGSQFASKDYSAFLKNQGIRQSMDGKARWVDNVIIERWFRSLKTEDIYINEYATPRQLKAGIRGYIERYNNERPHQSLDYATPAEVYFGETKAEAVIA